MPGGLVARYRTRRGNRADLDQRAGRNAAEASARPALENRLMPASLGAPKDNPALTTPPLALLPGGAGLGGPVVWGLPWLGRGRRRSPGFQDVPPQLATLEIGVVHIGDFQFTAR